MDWDEDIAKMTLSAGEKDGLQVFRNYSTAFEKHRIKNWAAKVDAEGLPLDDLQRFMALLADEDIRFLPVIACSFIDDQLVAMYKRSIPDGVPGGKAAMLGGLGPLSKLAERIQVAYAFGWLSSDVLEDADRLRKIRNDISHKWDIRALESRIHELLDQRLTPLETIMPSERIQQRLADLDSFARLRIRFVWIIGRAFYEAHFYPSALEHRLDPDKALYGDGLFPNVLRGIVAAMMNTTETITTKARAKN